MKFSPAFSVFAVLAGVLLMSLSPTPASADLVSREIPYKDGDTQLTGYFVYDDAIATPMPGVLVIHEWWGHNDYARKRADMLAKLGYAAFALDMYGTNKVADTPDDAKKLAGPFYENRGLMHTRALAGLAILKEQPQVDTTRLGAIGYCFGGTVALELARRGEDLKGVVSFHGGLAAPERAEPGRVKAQVLALNGGDDKMVTPEERANFVEEMKAAGVNFKSIDYPGALHAFTNPKATVIGERFNMPIAYNESADRQSWDEMQEFFTRLFARH